MVVDSEHPFLRLERTLDQIPRLKVNLEDMSLESDGKWLTCSFLLP